MSTAPRPPASPAAPPLQSGRLVAGVLLVLFGAGWLLEVLDVTDVPWDVLLPAALVLVGVALVVAARSGAGHTGLIATGVVLTVLLVVGSAIDFPVGGGVGEREEHPGSVGELREEFRLGVGQLTIDLTDLSFDDIATTERVRARVGIGQLVVIVPPQAPVRVVARATLGNVQVFELEDSGFEVERTRAPAADPVLDLMLSVGLGQVEVRRG